MAQSNLPVAFTAILAVINNTKLKRQQRIERISKTLQNNDTFDINTTDNTGRSLLHYACNKGIHSIVEYLLFIKNIDINIVSEQGFSPLIECALGYSNTHGASSSADHGAISEMNKGSFFNQMNIKKKPNKAYNHFTCLKLLLTSGKECDTEIKSKVAGHTALHEAAFGKFEDAVTLLCEQPQCNVNSTNHENETPLMVAITRRYISIARILLKRNDIDVNLPAYKQKMGISTPLAMAARLALSSDSLSDVC